MSNDDAKYWLALKFSEESIGNITIAALVDRFGSPQHVLEASVDELIEKGRVQRTVAERIAHFDDWDRIAREIELANELGMSIIPLSSSRYPLLLKSIYNRPCILYVKGSFVKDEATVAFVGSRSASAYGKYITENLSRELALKGITVVSGMARGIDTCAHRGALTGHGRTIAVLGSGLNVIYPPENEGLYHDISTRGAVISEFPLNSEPKSSHFPRRNRIISGLSLGVVIVEANEKSGSLITARHALEQGREVFAVPGPIDSPGSKGTHRLIREGAKLTETVDDILEEIAPQITSVFLTPHHDPVTSDATHACNPAYPPSETAILQLLGRSPAHIDEIIATSGMDAGQVLAVLTSMEIRGLIVQQTGKTYSLKKRRHRITQ